MTKFYQKNHLITSSEKKAWSFSTKRDFDKLTKDFKSLYEFFGAPNHFDLSLCESHEEALAQVLQSHYKMQSFPSGRNQFLTTDCTFLATWRNLEGLKSFGVETIVLEKQANGILTKDNVEKAINKKTTLISIVWAHPVTGIIQPVQEIAALCKEKNIALHVDMSAALFELDIPLKDLDCDYLTFNLSDVDPKHHYTAGVFASPFMQLRPLIPGFGAQALKGGAFDLTKLDNLVRYLNHEKSDFYSKLFKLSKRKKQFIKEVKDTLKNFDVLLEASETLPSCLCLTAKKFYAEFLQFVLSQKDLQITFGGGDCPQLKTLLKFSSLTEKEKLGAFALSINQRSQEDLSLLVTSLKDIETRFEKLMTNEESDA